MDHVLDLGLDKVKFLPWIGDEYTKAKWNGTLLVLGESHYSVDEDDKYITRQLTCDYINEKWSHAFWTNIMQVVTGIHHSQLSRADFWQSVAFYNFIQTSLDEARVSPDQQMWIDAEVPFLQVLNVLKPERILVLGYRLWNEFNCGGKESGFIEENGTVLNLWSITRDDGGETLCACLQHPSSGFSSNTWAPLVNKFIYNTKN